MQIHVIKTYIDNLVTTHKIQSDLTSRGGYHTQNIDSFLELCFLTEFFTAMTYFLGVIHEPLTTRFTKVTFNLAMFESMRFKISLDPCFILRTVRTSKPGTGVFFNMPVPIT